MASLKNKQVQPSVLDRIIKGGGSNASPKFEFDDFKDIESFIRVLAKSRDPLSSYLRKTFDTLGFPGSWEDISRGKPVSEDVRLSILQIMNQVMKSSSLYDENRFRHVRLTKRVKKFLSVPRHRHQPLENENEKQNENEIRMNLTNLQWLNRWLIEEAYADIRSKAPPRFGDFDLQQVVDFVARDISALLSARWEMVQGVPSTHARLQDSLLLYGLPDFTGLSAQSTDHRQMIEAEIKSTLEKFEKRLESIQVSFQKNPEHSVHAWYFRIDAILKVDPPHEVVFDVISQLDEFEGSSHSQNASHNFGSFVVKGLAHA